MVLISIWQCVAMQDCSVLIGYTKMYVLVYIHCKFVCSQFCAVYIQTVCCALLCATFTFRVFAMKL